MATHADRGNEARDADGGRCGARRWAQPVVVIIDLEHVVVRCGNARLQVLVGSVIVVGDVVSVVADTPLSCVSLRRQITPSSYIGLEAFHDDCESVR